MGCCGGTKKNIGDYAFSGKCEICNQKPENRMFRFQRSIKVNETIMVYFVEICKNCYLSGNVNEMIIAELAKKKAEKK